MLQRCCVELGHKVYGTTFSKYGNGAGVEPSFEATHGMQNSA
jgi:hypothetical protein